MTTPENTRIIPLTLDHTRLDQAAAELFDDFSRSRLQRWIKDGKLTVNGEHPSSPRSTVYAGDTLRLEADTAAVGGAEWVATDMALPVEFEDAHILVLNKPHGLVMHPAAGHHDDTLLNGLLAHCPALAEIPRAGIVHRLDRDTTGLLVVAKTLAAQNRLVQAIQDRDVKREYLAVVNGVVVSGGTIEKSIGRHPRDRQRQAVLPNGGKPAVTHYRVRERYRVHALLHCILETGRTHQIRVHMQSIGHTIVGDPVYGGRPKLPKGAGQPLIDALQGFGRQALHAWRLSFDHPVTGQPLQFQAEPPEDMYALCALLLEDAVEYEGP